MLKAVQPKRPVDWIELLFFFALFFFVYSVTPRAQEYVSRRTTDLPNATSTRITDHIVLATEFGNLKFGLYGEAAPNHVKQFKTLVAEGYYTGCSFYRSTKGFIQAGCSRTIGKDPRPALKLEYKLANTRGRVFMTRSDGNDPSCASTEFAINRQDNSLALGPGGNDPHGSTVFMELTESTENWKIVEKIYMSGSAKITSILAADDHNDEHI